MKLRSIDTERFSDITRRNISVPVERVAVVMIPPDALPVRPQRGPKPTPGRVQLVVALYKLGDCRLTGAYCGGHALQSLVHGRTDRFAVRLRPHRRSG